MTTVVFFSSTAWCIRPVFTVGRARVALYRKARTTTATAYCKGLLEGAGTGFGNGPWKGLSGVRGNCAPWDAVLNP